MRHGSAWKLGVPAAGVGPATASATTTGRPGTTPEAESTTMGPGAVLLLTVAGSARVGTAPVVAEEQQRASPQGGSSRCPRRVPGRRATRPSARPSARIAAVPAQTDRQPVAGEDTPADAEEPRAHLLCVSSLASVLHARTAEQGRRQHGARLQNAEPRRTRRPNAMAGVDSAPPEPASDEIKLSAPPFRLPTAARTSRACVPLSLAAILRSGSCRTSPSGHR